MWPGSILTSPQFPPLSYCTSWSLQFSYPSSVWRYWRLLSSQFFWNTPPGIPQCLNLHLKNSNPMCWMMKTFLNFPHTCCCSCCIIYPCFCFHFACFRFLLCYCFGNFSLTPPWAFGTGHCSWCLTIFNLHNHTLVDGNKLFLLKLSCLYSVRGRR